MAQGSRHSLIDSPWTKSEQDVLGELGVSIAKGLNNKEVRERQKRFGWNRLQEVKKKNTWVIPFFALILL